MPAPALTIFSARLRRAPKSLAAASLALLLAGEPLLAAPLPAPATAAPLTPRQRVVHALDRLSFGPRPGEVEAVSREGLDRWFERQLQPATIDDTALDGRLDAYPALKLTPAELQEHFPSPGMLRQMENGRRPLPEGPEARALAEDQIAIYKLRKQAAETAKSGDKVAASVDDTAQAGMAASPQPQEEGAGKRKQVPAGPPFPAAEADRILTLAPPQRMAAILALAPNDLIRFRASLRPAQLASLTDGLTPQQRETLLGLAGSGRLIALETMDARVLRDVYSSRELEAVMTDFWLNHFNVYARKNQNEPYLLPAYERTVRANALGNFETLLVATAQSPAMLTYLDNFRSIGPDSQAAARVERLKAAQPDGMMAKKASAGLNENYGRELMELHTLGVNGGYTQADVTEVAKVFTGWTIAGGQAQAQGTGGDPELGGYRFDPRRHQPGSKSVLGHTIRAGGEAEGLEVLHLLASSPATAHFISEKLAVRFVSDDPPAALVDRMAATFLASHGDIKSVLRTLFHAPEFWSAGVYRAKVKTPEEFVFSALRASGAEVANPTAVVQSLDRLGMPLYGMQTPNGYSWKEAEWVSTGALVSRMNFALVLSGGRLPGVRTAWASASGVQPAGYTATGAAEEKERRLENMLLAGEPVSERTRATVLGQGDGSTVTEQAATQFDLRAPNRKAGYRVRGLAAAQGSGTDDPEAGVMAGLLLGSPEFQRR